MQVATRSRLARRNFIQLLGAGSAGAVLAATTYTPPLDRDADYLPGAASLFLYAHEAYYGLEGFASAVIKPAYQETTHQFYLGNLTWEDAAPLLPRHPGEMFEEDFLAALDAGNSHYAQILQDSHAYRWRMKTPLRTYYGGSDEVAPSCISKLPVGDQELTGGNQATAIAAGDKVDHRDTFVYAVADEKKWFDDLLKSE